MELYPLKFKPILKETIWGGQKIKEQLQKDSKSDQIGESWEISGVEGNVSVVSNGFLKDNDLNELIEVYMSELVGEKIYQTFGNEFPLLFKFIDAQDLLSVQVHPDNDLAKERHNAYGKTEMWYVLDAEPESEMIVGFNQNINQETYLKHFKSGTLTEVLNTEKVQKGDVFFIPAGRIHAIGKGILVAEIQQTSDVTYRIYDWDRKDANGKGRELHTDLVVDALNFDAETSYKTDYQPRINESVNLADCSYFTTNLLDLDKAIETDYSLLDSFVVLMCIEGETELSMGHNEILLKQGETVLIPAIAELVTITPKPKSKLLEIYIKPDNLS